MVDDKNQNPFINDLINKILFNSLADRLSIYTIHNVRPFPSHGE